MTAGVVHLELLLGRRVRDGEGRVVGRIEEVRAERVDQECVIREYHLGPGALMERLSVRFVRIFKGLGHGAIVVPWDAMDLTDPLHPRLNCRRDELTSGLAGTLE